MSFYNEWDWHGMGKRIEGQVQYRVEGVVDASWFKNMREIGERFL